MYIKIFLPLFDFIFVLNRYFLLMFPKYAFLRFPISTSLYDPQVHGYAVYYKKYYKVPPATAFHHLNYISLKDTKICEVKLIKEPTLVIRIDLTSDLAPF